MNRINQVIGTVHRSDPTDYFPAKKITLKIWGVLLVNVNYDGDWHLYPQMRWSVSGNLITLTK